MPRHDSFGSAASHDVDARLPADPGFVAALRALATALAARCDWTVDDIEDLQIGVDEACALVLPHARQPGGQLSVHLQVMPASADIVVSVPADASVVPDRSGFSWTVLSAVTDHMHMTSGAGSLAIRFSQHCTSRLRRLLCSARATTNAKQLDPARRFTGRNTPLEDIVQVGAIGLPKAIGRFDQDRGLEFSSYFDLKIAPGM